MTSLTEYLKSQEELLHEASIALPHQFSRCTYSLGPLRSLADRSFAWISMTDAVSLGKQCIYVSLAQRLGDSVPPAQLRATLIMSKSNCMSRLFRWDIERGLKSSLRFPKRNFRCDCPTVAIAHPCTLHQIPQEENASNRYGQNFKGDFCRCGKPYDAKTEREAMIQCLACEVRSSRLYTPSHKSYELRSQDWFHESCCNLRNRPSSREVSPVDLSKKAVQTETGDEDDAVSDTSSSGLPPPLISGDDYEAFVCGSCVSKNPTLTRWAGSPGVTMIVRDNPTDPWRCLSDNVAVSDEPLDFNSIAGPSITGMKRPLSPSMTDMPGAKRARGIITWSASTGPCLAPPPNVTAGKIFTNYKGPFASVNGTGDIFFSEGFRTRWCRCSSVSISPCSLFTYAFG